ncbi:MAG TPA: YhdH/YhfP family quinone oxidoreductase [Cellvibrionaceae bacterium]
MTQFAALQTTLLTDQPARTEVVTRQQQDLPRQDLLVAVEYSCLNYKDALSAAGNKGVSRNYPHTPGIDAAGSVVRDGSGRFAAGQRVLVSGFDMGMNSPGGLAERLSVPAEWACVCPDNLSLIDAMTLGTAGLTAAMCIDKLESVGARAGDELLVTGASGGVGSLAVLLAAARGYKVTAMTGKADAEVLLQTLGASCVTQPDQWLAASDKPLLKPQWSYAVDTLGGDALFNVLKATHAEGAVAACGLAAGAEFAANVYPFILRGVSLLGVDSAERAIDYKATLWQRLAVDASPAKLALLRREISLAEAPEYLQKMLSGHSLGRVVVAMSKA